MASSAGRPVRNDGLIATDLGDEYLVYDNGTDRIHVLNLTARDLLMMCDGSRGVVELAAELTNRYDVDESTARKDVEETLVKLERLGLIAYG